MNLAALLVEWFRDTNDYLQRGFRFVEVSTAKAIWPPGNSDGGEANVLSCLPWFAAVAGNVFISGLKGSGRHRLARALHASSCRSTNRLVELDSGTQCQDALSDALSDVTAFLEEGTILLKNVDKMTVETQELLFDLMLGLESIKMRSRRVRLLSVSGLSPREIEKEKRMRIDLLTRLKAIHVRPPLDLSVVADLEQIADRMMYSECRRLDLEPKQLDAAARKLLQRRFASAKVVDLMLAIQSLVRRAGDRRTIRDLDIQQLV